LAGINTGNSWNGYSTKTIISDYGECEIAVPRDRNGEFEPKIIEKRQTRTDEIESKIMAMYAKGFSAEGYPVKRKTAIFIVASHSFIPQPASGCSSALPCLAAILVYPIFAVKRIYTVLFLEPYFNTLKNELICHHYYRSEKQLYLAVSDFAFLWYNHIRPHAFNKGLTPFQKRCSA
jgi:hypothetical protein